MDEKTLSRQIRQLDDALKQREIKTASMLARKTLLEEKLAKYEKEQAFKSTLPTKVSELVENGKTKQEIMSELGISKSWCEMLMQRHRRNIRWKKEIGDFS